MRSMASPNLCKIPSSIESGSGDDGIMYATFDCEAKLPLSDTYEAISDNLVDLDSKNLNLSQVGSLTSVPQENNVENNPGNKTYGLNLSLNKTFDTRQKKSDANETRGVVLDKTINLLSMKPVNLSLHLDSEESLGIISDVLDENTTLDLLVPFKSREKSTVQFIKKSSDANLLTFSPLHLRNSNRVYLEDNGSPMICRFTSTPEPPSSKQLKNSDMKQEEENKQLPPTEEEVTVLNFMEPKKCFEEFEKGSIFSATSKVSQLKGCINIIEDCLNIIETTPILPKDLQSESNKVQLGENQMKEDYPIEEGVTELDSIELEKCYEDFKKGNIFASTSKVSQLKNCLNKIEATPLLPNDLHPESDNVQLGKNITLEINSADQSSLLLNATFDVKPEPLKEELPISELQTDTVTVSLKDIPKNETFTFDSINNAAEEKDNKVNTTFIDLPKESNLSNLREAFSSCLSISDIDESKQKEHDSYIIKSTNKSNFEAKRPMFKRSIAIPIQKLNPSKIENNLNSELNSTFCMGSNEPSNNNPTNLDKRCSLESSLGISGHSNIGLLKTHSQLKSNRISNSKCIGYKPPEIKAASASTRSARISLGKNAVSPIKQKNLINISLSRTTVKPRINSQIKKPNSEEKFSLDNTFTKDDKINFALSPIIEQENKFTESMEKVLNLSYVEKNRALLPSKIDVENKKIPKYTPSGNPSACTPIENENKKNSTSNQCVEKPAFLTRRFQKVDSTNIPLPTTKPKQPSNDKLVSTKKTNDSIIPKSQNINLNGKCNLLQTLKDPQFSRLPTLGSTFSKKVIPNRPKVNRMMPIESLRVLPNQCSSTSNSKPVQSVRMLRAPGISIPRENKLKAPSVFGKTVSSCLEKGF